MVSASGAMNLVLAGKVSLTMPSMASTIISIAHCNLPGTPAVARRATRMKKNKKRTASSSLKKMLSMLRVMNGESPTETVRCSRWCLM
jgi:hypothetical protein